MAHGTPGVCTAERCRLLARVVGRPAEPKAMMGRRAPTEPPRPEGKWPAARPRCFERPAAVPRRTASSSEEHHSSSDMAHGTPGVCAAERCRLLAGLVGRPAEPKATMGGRAATEPPWPEGKWPAARPRCFERPAAVPRAEPRRRQKSVTPAGGCGGPRCRRRRGRGPTRRRCRGASPCGSAGGRPRGRRRGCRRRARWRSPRWRCRPCG